QAAPAGTANCAARLTARVRRLFEVHSAYDQAMTHAVTEANKAIREFFEAYAKATKSLDLAFLGSAYGDPFMFAGPGGVQAVKRDDFLKVIPKRGAFFKAAGLMTTEVRRLEEIRLDET